LRARLDHGVFLLSLVEQRPASRLFFGQRVTFLIY
jgi:hypothetical protein